MNNQPETMNIYQIQVRDKTTDTVIEFAQRVHEPQACPHCGIELKGAEVDHATCRELSEKYPGQVVEVTNDPDRMVRVALDDADFEVLVGQ